MSFDGFSLAPLVKELDKQLTGGRIEKIFQSDAVTLLLWIRQATENLKLLISVSPENPRLHLVTSLPENPATPPAFCMLMRKYLADGRIVGIKQHSLDRMVSIYVDTRGEGGAIVTKEIIIELMGKHSNIILVKDDLILDAIKRIGPHLSSYRQVLPGKNYIFPPDQNRLNLYETTAHDFITVLRTEQANALLAKAIIRTGIGLGPQTAKEIIYRSGLPADIAVSALDAADSAALAEAIDSLIKPLQAGQLEPQVIVTAEQALLAVTPCSLEHLQQYEALSQQTMSAALAFACNLQEPLRIPGQDSLQGLVTGELAKLVRKQTVLSVELTTAQSADELRKAGDLLMANLTYINPGATEALVTDFYSSSPEETQLTIPLDKLITPLQNAQQYYARYHKAKRAQESLALQLAQCQETIQYLESIAVALSLASTGAEVIEIHQELIAAGYIKQTGKRRLPTVVNPPLSAATSDGWAVLIGKNNYQNDIVTFKRSHHDDIWLHTKDIPGSHVILKTGAAQPSTAALTEAAQLAAYFSKARQSAKVPVDYARRRHVRKPAGAKPGFVIYDHQSTIYVTPDHELIKNLLEPQPLVNKTADCNSSKLANKPQ